VSRPIYCVGSIELQIQSATDEILIPTWVLYPTQSSETFGRVGPYEMTLAWNAPPLRMPCPLVLVSHGTGGSHLGYRHLAKCLAAHGYVVAMPEHPGNNRRDNHLADTTEILARRPSDLSDVVEALYQNPQLSSTVERHHFSVVGHSLGGYTALALAGGVPRTQTGESIPVVADSRLDCAVLLAPATPWFMDPDSLQAIDVPVLMLTAEHDPHTPGFHADIVRSGLRDEVGLEHHVVTNAGHFSFMSPFPESMCGPQFPPGNDPHGFDREAYLPLLQNQVLDFLARARSTTL